MKKDLILKIIMALSLLGVLTSIYLVKNHYAGIEKGSFCDFNENISCSLVNTSIYSEFLNVPVALFGALWFVILLLLVWRARKQSSHTDALLTLLLEWNVLGFLSVLYMIYAEV
ncbi:hypothetical protein HYX13_02155, partial [Candidatus Woesearchaeota archaeon]|nr:hypothetical protein [Candidatus Woesearchaeota archaeon]